MVKMSRDMGSHKILICQMTIHENNMEHQNCNIFDIVYLIDKEVKNTK